MSHYEEQPGRDSLTGYGKERSGETLPAGRELPEWALIIPVLIAVLVVASSLTFGFLLYFNSPPNPDYQVTLSRSEAELAATNYCTAQWPGAHIDRVYPSERATSQLRHFSEWDATCIEPGSRQVKFLIVTADGVKIDPDQTSE